MPLRIPYPTPAQIDQLILEIQHNSIIFPLDTDEFTVEELYLELRK